MKIHAGSNLALPRIGHGFFTRHGGVSTGVYESLNCGPGSGDASEKVAENRRRVVAALAPATRLVTLAQIHSPVVHRVDANWDDRARPQGDGLATNQPGWMLGILTADCAPVLLADAEAGVIGAAHAGWKGAVGGVLEATVAAMEGLGARRGAIHAAIGPCISQANYEVGPEFPERLGGKRFLNPAENGHFRFDLAGFVVERLKQAGIPSIESLGLCTYPPENGFFSFRRTTHRGEGDYGRQISVIVIKQP